MRRMMLDLCQTAGSEWRSRVCKNAKKAESRISASSLARIAERLQVPVEFFFERAPHQARRHHAESGAANLTLCHDPAKSDGLDLTKAFMQIADAKIRSRGLVEKVADAEDR